MKNTNLGVYKIVIADVGGYLPYLYKRKFFFWWKFIKVGNPEPWPCWGSALTMKEEYNVPDKRVSFKFKKSK